VVTLVVGCAGTSGSRRFFVRPGRTYLEV